MNQTELTLTVQRRVEELFAGCVFANPAWAVERCNWLSADIIQDTRIKAFWKAIQNGHKEDPTGAAFEAGCYVDMIGWVAEAITTEAESYAHEIQRRHWLVSQDKTITDLLQARQNNDVEGMRVAVALLSQDCPPKVVEIPTAQTIGLAFNEELQKPKPTNLIYTGIPNLDRAIVGLQKKLFYVVASRPSMGKTTWAWQIARNVAHARRVIYFSNEMTAQQLWSKAACGAVEVQWRDVLARRISPEQLQAIMDNSTELMCMFEDRLMIDDRIHLTTDNIWRIVAQEKPELVIVDVMARLKDKGDNLIQRLGSISYALKEIAKDQDCAVMAIHHVGRGVEEKSNGTVTGRKPVMSDLSDSGNIEKAADSILFLHSDEYYQISSSMKPPRYLKTTMIIGKDREAPRNSDINFAYDTAQQWFYPASEIWPTRA